MGRTAHHGPSQSGGMHFLDVPGTKHHQSHRYSHSRGLSTDGSTTTTTLLAPLRPFITPLQLPPRAESTRARLQRELVHEQQQQQYSLLPLASVNSTILPGIKTSAAFFASLRTNLSLHASPPLPSPLPTPPSMRASTSYLAPPSPLSVAMDAPADQPEPLPSGDLFDGVPELTTYVATTDADRTAALKLTADSVAQMRQAANRSLIYHPLNLAVVIAIVAYVSRLMQHRSYEWFAIVTTSVGIISAALLTCRHLTHGYLSAAEEMDFDWLGDSDAIVTRFGDEVIGAVIIDWLSGESRTKKKKAWQGEIKAWTVRLKYRGKGVGTALLQETVKEACKKGAESLEFAEDHANSKRVLPALYNRNFDKEERWARELLMELYQSSPMRSKKKS